MRRPPRKTGGATPGSDMRPRTPGRVAALAVAAAMALTVAATASCARQWPAEPPDAHQWQLTTGPLNLVPQRVAGRMLAAFAYAQQRPSPSSCDGIGEDDCEDYAGRYGRHLPARLAVACWDPDSDGRGEIDITFTPSRPILDDPRLHPRTWGGWGLDFDGDSGPDDVLVGFNDDSPGLIDGFVAFVPGERLIERALRYFSETAGGEHAELRVVATFPDSDGSPPLEWRFDLGAESMADERIRHVAENCGRVW